MPSSPPPIAFSSLARGRVSFEIVAQVTQAIAQGSIPLGSYLPTEPQLMAQFGVGRNALREAIKILEAFGLVTVRRGAGTYVQDSCTFDLLVPLFLRLLLALPHRGGPSGGLPRAGPRPGPGSPHPGGGEHLRPDRPPGTLPLPGVQPGGQPVPPPPGRGKASGLPSDLLADHPGPGRPETPSRGQTPH